VEGSDVTSLIFYWANKGYIKIDLENEKNPIFIRIVQQLPDDAPQYQKIMYNDLFKKGDEVKTSQLENKFYTTVDKVTKNVNATTKKLYDGKSIGISLIFALIGGLFAGLAPIIFAMVRIHPTLFLGSCLAVIIPVIVIYVLTQSLMYNKLKISGGKFKMCLGGIIALSLVFTLFYAVLVPAEVLGVASKIIVCIAAYAMAIISVTLINRTPDYSEKLNQIIGFKEFILYAEKDRLEAMLEDDPQLYYHVLPYAQVLGVTEKWATKFASLTVAPPNWVTHPMDTYVQFAVMNKVIRNMNANMTSKMVSRPSSSGMSGGSGGSFGSFGGGGHGGGGFRGR
jgi:uncharacterized membrane protein